MQHQQLAPSSSCSGGSAKNPVSTNVLKRKLKSQIICNTGASSSFAASTNNLKNLNEISRALRTDVSLVPPIRQTASIFKQPVTIIRNHENTKVKHDTKNGAQQDKPKQLFWEKRLEHMRACHATGEQFDEVVLPKTLRSLGPNVNEQTVLQSVATALHILSAPVTGQPSPKSEFIKNAAAYINPDQPLIQAVIVSEDDIRKQEDRVSVARRKLQDALKS